MEPRYLSASRERILSPQPSDGAEHWDALVRTLKLKLVLALEPWVDRLARLARRLGL